MLQPFSCPVTHQQISKPAILLQSVPIEIQEQFAGFHPEGRVPTAVSSAYPSDQLTKDCPRALCLHQSRLRRIHVVTRERAHAIPHHLSIVSHPYEWLFCHPEITLASDERKAAPSS